MAGQRAGAGAAAAEGLGSVSRGGSVGGCCTRSVLVEACLPATAQHADSGNLHGGALTCIAHAKDLFVEDCASMLREVHPEAIGQIGH